MFNSNSKIWAPVSALLVAGLMSGGGVVWSEATQSSIKVCVNKETKVVKYKKTCNLKERSIRLSLRGEAGKSAYQIWLDQGYSGTEMDFLNFLKGAPGRQSVDFARTCYQQLMKAESQGLIWTDQENRNRFERSTGCEIREIDINPNSNTKARAELFPLITNARFLGRGGGAGDYGAGRGFNSQQIYYDVDVQLPDNYVLCSIDTENDYGPRVFYAPNGKIIVLGLLEQSELYFRSILNLGYGSIETGAQTDEGETDVFDASPYNVIASKRISLPLDSIISLEFGLEQQLPELPELYEEDFWIRTSNVLAKVLGYEYEDGVLRVQIQTNSREYGMEKLHLTLDEGSLTLPLNIGVEQCIHTIDSNLQFDVSSTLYVINERLEVAESPYIGDIVTLFEWGVGYSGNNAPSWFVEPQEQ